MGIYYNFSPGLTRTPTVGRIFASYIRLINPETSYFLGFTSFSPIFGGPGTPPEWCALSGSIRLIVPWSSETKLLLLHEELKAGCCLSSGSDPL